MLNTNYITKEELNNMIGSWHPRGFHGHARSKSRIEISNLYRQSAKPLPPEKFKKRQKEDVLKHTFSNHDNKQVFLNDPLLFGSGIGKKKIDSVNKNRWNPEFIAWCEDSGRDRIKRTMYQKDYCNNNQGLNSKLLTSRVSLENQPVSVYSCNFAPRQELVEDCRETRRDTYYRFINKNRAKSSVGERVTVASCMVWNDKIKLSSAKTEPELKPLDV